jgi:hypothetical protein
LCHGRLGVFVRHGVHGERELLQLLPQCPSDIGIGQGQVHAPQSEMAQNAVLEILQAITLQLRRDHPSPVTPVHALFLMGVHRQEIHGRHGVAAVREQRALEIPAPGHLGVVRVTACVALELVDGRTGSGLEIDRERRQLRVGFLRQDELVLGMQRLDHGPALLGRLHRRVGHEQEARPGTHAAQRRSDAGVHDASISEPKRSSAEAGLRCRPRGPASEVVIQLGVP